MSQHLTSKSFSDHLHTTFYLAQPPERAPLELIEVIERNDSREFEQFSLIFRAAREPVLPQRTYHVEHETLGSMDLFLVPIGPDDSGMRYQAVFNRFRNTEA